MSELSDRQREVLENTLTEFQRLREVDAEADFESWVRQHPEQERDLRILNAALQGMQRDAEAPPSAALEQSLERNLEVLEEIGSGGFGRVHRAHDPVLQRDVALKVLAGRSQITGAVRRRFLEEARVLAKLDHPNIVRVHSIEHEGGEIKLILELIEGRTLKDIVDTDGPLSAEEAARVGVALCSALSALHARNIVHLDVKPGNVMRAGDGRVVLLDFGLARALREDATLEPVGGTPPFMSPEQFESAARIEPASDIYSLGALLYWIVSGHYAFDCDELSVLRELVLEGRQTPLAAVRPDIDPRFAAIVERAMAASPADRPSSAGALQDELEAYLRRRASGPLGRRGVLAAGVALAGLAAGWALWGGADRTELKAAAGSLDADMRLYRLTPGGDPKDDEALENGAPVAIGDQLYVTASSDRPFYFYLFNEDAEGRCFTLFPPNASLPLAPGEPIRLPGAARSRTWEVNTPGGGAEHFFFVASAEPHPLAESLLRYVPRPTDLAADLERKPTTLAQLAPEERREIFRGVGIERGAAENPGQERLVDVFRHLLSDAAPNTGAKVQAIQLVTAP